jgi:hypothetical protein
MKGGGPSQQLFCFFAPSRLPIRPPERKIQTPPPHLELAAPDPEWAKLEEFGSNWKLIEDKAPFLLQIARCPPLALSHPAPQSIRSQDARQL